MYSGGNGTKIGLPGKLILSKRKGSSGSPFLLKIVSENRFSGKTYFYTIGSRPRSSSTTPAGQTTAPTTTMWPRRSRRMSTPPWTPPASSASSSGSAASSTPPSGAPFNTLMKHHDNPHENHYLSKSYNTEFLIPSCREVFQIIFRELPLLVGRYCS